LAPDVVAASFDVAAEASALPAIERAARRLAAEIG